MPSLSFVVQKHAARSLHYDFRLELDGTFVDYLRNGRGATSVAVSMPCSWQELPTLTGGAQ